MPVVHYPAGPWLRVVFNFSNNEKFWSSDVWWKQTTSPPGSLNIATVAAAVDTAVQTPMLAALGTDAQYQGNDCYFNNGTYTVAAHTFPGASGTGAGNCLPTEVAAIVALNSGVGTRAGVGRLFFGGVDESNVSESRISGAGLTLYAAIYTALKGLTSPGGLTLALAVWSRKLNALEPVVFGNPKAILGHRRKRRPRR